MRGNINYLSSFTFREAFSDSFNEAVFTSVSAVAFLNKDWSTYTFDTVVERQQDFQSAEIMTTNPVTGKSTTESNAVIVRKLPEVDFSSRDHQITPDLPVWYSFQSSGGLLSRSQPYFDGNNNLIDRYETDFFTSRVNLAPEITTAFHFGDFHVVPSFSVNETYYAES